MSQLNRSANTFDLMKTGRLKSEAQVLVFEGESRKCPLEDNNDN
jgi:hypothetical protein